MKLDPSIAPDQVQLFELPSKFLQVHRKEKAGNNRRWRERYSTNSLELFRARGYEVLFMREME